MIAVETGLDSAVLIEPRVFGDNRGWFTESYSREKFAELGIDVDFVQDNRSYSAKKGTLRGMHCQTNPCAQAKLVSCVRGEILDVIVDLRRGSPSYLKNFSAVLTSENKRMLFVPRGFLHGFVTLCDDCEIFYKVDSFYSHEHDRSIRFDDKALGISWSVESPVLSEKDKNAPLLCDSDVEFAY